MARLHWFGMLGLPLLAGSLLAGCLLADVSIDENLDPPGAGGGPDMGVQTLQGGSAGATGATTPPDPSTCRLGNTDNDEPDREQACTDYCNLYMCICAGQPANSYANFSACFSLCNTPDLWPVGSYMGIEPGTVTCRYYHSTLALMTGSLDPHCYHAAAEPSKSGGCEMR